MQPEAKDTKNLVLALAISTAILMGWHFFYEMPRQKALETAGQTARAQSPAPRQDAQTAHMPVAAAPVGTSPDAPVPLTREAALAESGRITVRSNALHGSIALKAARFDDLTLARYHEALDKRSPEVTLLSPSKAPAAYFAEMGWLAAGAGVSVPDAHTVWQSADAALSPGKPVVLFWDNPENIRFEMEVAMDDHFMFTVTQRVRNGSAASVALTPYGLINRSHTQAGEKFYILHEGPLGIKEDALFEVDYDQLVKEGTQTVADTYGWVGITDKYWLTAIIPEKGRFKASFQHYTQGDQERFQSDLLGEPITLTPGGEASYTVRFFAGAKEVWLLDKYADQYRIPLFDRAVDFGSLYFLTKPIFLMLDYFNKLLGNFGLAILLLTVIIKILLFPLANKSYASMAQMKNLMPKMTEIRERHTDDKMKMNQEIIGLYKKEGVNPASGCLPMLIQIPIFFALYKVLFVTIEMRHAPFFGWIQDLSAKDPTNLFTLFGLISWTPPSFLHLGAWPIIMAATMVLQQHMSPKPADPVQAQVMQVMPFLFLFLFAGFPAGLVLYWAWNNGLSVLQQWVITKKLANRPPKRRRAASKASS